MIQFISYSFMLLLCSIFFQLSHPLALGFILLLQTLVSCIMIFLNHESSWFAYILFLIFLGGMLILFIYITSVASNEKFSFSFNLLSMTLILMVIALLIIFLFKDMYESIYTINNFELNEYLFKSNSMENSKSIMKFYNFPSNILTIILINYLFFALIVIVKITNFSMGPLRSIK